MNKLQIVIHCLPREVDQLERVLDKLHESSFFLSPDDKVILDITLNLNTLCTDWSNSKIDKQFFKQKFELMRKKSSWAYKTLFEIDEQEKCLGINDKRRNSINSLDKEITHVMYLDLDLFFSKVNLALVFQAISQIKNKYHIISSELTKLWDDSWNVLCSNTFAGESNNFWKTVDPYSIESLTSSNSFSVEHISTVKFGGGWFNVFSANLLKFISIPDSLGSYGLDDTFVMESSKLMQSKGYDLKQYVLRGAIVCENIKYELYGHNPYENYIKDNTLQDQGRVFKSKQRENAMKNFNIEIEKFIERI